MIRFRRSERIDPATQEVVKFWPTNPPRRGEHVLVNGVRYRVTRSRISWDGPQWTIRNLRGVQADLAIIEGRG